MRGINGAELGRKLDTCVCGGEIAWRLRGQDGQGLVCSSCTRTPSELARGMHQRAIDIREARQRARIAEVTRELRTRIEALETEVAALKGTQS